jgi:hypothetical protein
LRFDDRLLTVLSQPADDRHDVAVRWRQLVDLVARAGSSQDSPVFEQALATIRADASLVDEPLRAAAARSIAAWPLPLGLLRYFASDRLSVAAPVLAAAKLEPSQWRHLHDSADDETRNFIASLHPDASDEPSEPVQAAVPPTTEEPQPYVPPSLHEVVERIERRRQMRAQEMAASEPEPAAAAVDAPSAFRWECDAGGEIAWVEGAPRGPLIGRSIARGSEAEGNRIDQAVARAFGMRAPFRDAIMRVGAGGAVSGEWKISGIPAFDSTDGRFAGYRGVALREVARPEATQLAPMPEVLADPASLRELVHEIKTPLNAIIGFAEIIEGQYLGPADRGYRDRASEIVRQARLLLTAIDDLDFAAKIHTAAGGAAPQADLGILIADAIDELRRKAAVCGVQLALVGSRQKAIAAVQPELASRLLFRLFDLLLAEAYAKERLQIDIAGGEAGPRLSISRPERLRGVVIDLDSPPESAGNATFAMRLVRDIARIAGGDLMATRDGFALIFRAAG